MIYWSENQQPLGCFIHYVGKLSFYYRNGIYIKDKVIFIWYNQGANVCFVKGNHDVMLNRNVRIVS